MNDVTWYHGETLESLEKRVIAKAYLSLEGNKEACAEMLGIAKRTLDYKIQRYGIPYIERRRPPNAKPEVIQHESDVEIVSDAESKDIQAQQAVDDLQTDLNDFITDEHAQELPSKKKKQR